MNWKRWNFGPDFDHPSEWRIYPDGAREDNSATIARVLSADMAKLICDAHNGADHAPQSELEIAVAQAVEFAQYVVDSAKGKMVQRAEHFLSLKFSQDIALRLSPIT